VTAAVTATELLSPVGGDAPSACQQVETMPRSVPGASSQPDFMVSTAANQLCPRCLQPAADLRDLSPGVYIESMIVQRVLLKPAADLSVLVTAAVGLGGYGGGGSLSQAQAQSQSEPRWLEDQLLSDQHRPGLEHE